MTRSLYFHLGGIYICWHCETIQIHIGCRLIVFLGMGSLIIRRPEPHIPGYWLVLQLRDHKSVTNSTGSLMHSDIVVCNDWSKRLVR
jgi:hypothetical protein